MGEARGQYHDKRLRRAFRYIYDNGTEYFQPHIVQSKLISRELQLEPKTADFAGLQVADLLAHPAHRTFKFMQQNIPVPEDYGASIVQQLEKVYTVTP
ncbi:ATP-dependent RNA circularization protein (DNA/RNA ligase family) [Bradyrhizobium sp. LB1.3]